MTDFNLLLEAERRGILPPDQKQALDVARQRGLIGSSEVAPPVLGREGFQGQIEAFTNPPEFGSPDALAEQSRRAQFTDDVVRGLADVFTFGFAGEAAAGANTALGRGDFESNLAAENQRDEAIPTEGRIASGVLGLAAPVGPAAQFIGRGANLATQALRGSAVSAAGGAAAGAGFAPEGERLRGAVTGGATGAVLGPAGVVAAPIAGLAARGAVAAFNRLPGRAAAREQARLATQQGKAVARVREMFDRDEITFEQASRKLRQLGPDATLADVGQENVRSGLSAAANVPGQAKRRAGRVLETRVRQQNRRLREAVQDGLSDLDFDQTVAGTLERRQNTAAPLYDAARASGVVDNQKLERIMRLKSVRSAITRVRERNPDLLDLPDNDVRVLDAVYKDLGGQRQAAIRAGERGSGSLAFDLGRRQNDLLDAIAEDVPVYRDAVRAFSDESSLLDAANLGRRFLREDAGVTARTLKGMSEGEREMFLTGATREIIDQIENTPNPSNAVRKIFGNEKRRKQLRSLFGTKREFDRFRLQMMTEQRFAETRNAVIPGSRTTPLAASVVDQNRSAIGEAAKTVAEGAITGDGGVTRRVIADLARRVAESGQPEEAFRNEIGRLLTTQGIEANEELLNQIFQRATSLANRP